MSEKTYQEMTVSELKKEQQRLWEVAVKAQRDASNRDNGEEIHRRRATYAMNEVNKIIAELKRREY